MSEILNIVPADPTKPQIRMVMVSEGYLLVDKNKFIDDAKRIFTAITTQDFWKQYSDYWYLTGIWQESNQSGADNPGNGTILDTAFDSTFYGFGIERLLVLANSGIVKLTNILQPLGFMGNALPPAVVLVNDPKYGGSGGTNYIAVSMNYQSIEIAKHEFCHGFGGVDDEYYLGGNTNALMAQYSSVNLDDTLDPLTVKWNDLITSKKLGTPVKGEGIDLWARPASVCLMRTLGVPLCEVCKRQMIKVLTTRLNIPLIPETSTAVSQPITTTTTTTTTTISVIPQTTVITIPQTTVVTNPVTTTATTIATRNSKKRR